MSNLVNQTEPTPDVYYVTWGWKMPNCVQVFWEWFYILLSYSESSKIDYRFAKLKLFRIDNYTVVACYFEEVDGSPPMCRHVSNIVKQIVIYALFQPYNV